MAGYPLSGPWQGRDGWGFVGRGLLPLCGLPSPTVAWLTAGCSNLGFASSSSLVGPRVGVPHQVGVWKGDGVKRVWGLADRLVGPTSCGLHPRLWRPTAP